MLFGDFVRSLYVNSSLGPWELSQKPHSPLLSFWGLALGCYLLSLSRFHQVTTWRSWPSQARCYLTQQAINLGMITGLYHKMEVSIYKSGLIRPQRHRQAMWRSGPEAHGAPPITLSLSPASPGASWGAPHKQLKEKKRLESDYGCTYMMCRYHLIEDSCSRRPSLGIPGQWWRKCSQCQDFGIVANLFYF